MHPVPFTDVRITGGMLGSRQETNRAVTIPFALKQCEDSNRLKNFDLAAETMRRRAAGETTFQNKPSTIYPFDDTDVYKSVEGASFSLSLKPDPSLAAGLEKMIDRVKAAQEPDGYLYTWRTMHPDSPVHDWIGQQRWEKDPILSHELYNLGHLYEAGVAHYQATGSRSLLDICLKSAELVYKDLADGNPPIATGHQVIEMGLVKLYHQTGDRRWIDLAKVLIDNRGKTPGSDYSQNHLQVIKQDKAVGHAVRANYMYSGMADVAALTGNQDYLKAITRIWENVVNTKLHLTGGCGARAAGEAYGEDYELPHNCYNETCAAIAFLFWNHRMFLMSGDAKYMDVFERSLYNGVLSGISLSGDRFFYPNPLIYDGKAANNHGMAGRAPWFGCACCPPNIMRLLASLGGYTLAVKNDQLRVNLYTQCEASATVAGQKIQLSQQTRYPWDGDVAIQLNPSKPTTFALALRIPGWVKGRPLPSELYHYEDATPADWSVSVNGSPVTPEADQGYAVVRRTWNPGDTVRLHLDMPVRRVSGNEHISDTRGQSALERGPVVYAFEGVDNDLNLMSLFLPATAKFSCEQRSDLLGGVTVINVTGAGLRTESGPTDTRLTAIPYAVWNNRGNSPMRVWLPRDVSLVPTPPKPTLASEAKLSVSFARPGMEVARINDQLIPLNATDGFAPAFDFWPHNGTQEWIQYTFKQPTKVSSVTVSWFDDLSTGGGCALPKSWRLMAQSASGTWEPVKHPSNYTIRKAEPVKVTFEPITTNMLRLEIQLQNGQSGGVHEWIVE